MILGPTQHGVLRALVGQKFWYYGCGWKWGSEANTERVLNSLVKKGLVATTVETILLGREATLYRATGMGEHHIAVIREAEIARKLALR